MSANFTYKSPRHMLVKFFKKSRDNWKSKYMEGKRKLKYFKNKVKYLQESKKKWKSQSEIWKAHARILEIQAKQLEQELAAVQSDEQPTIDNCKNVTKSVIVDNGNGVNTEYFESKIARHTYSVDHIFLFLCFVLFSATSLRGTANVMEVFFTFFGFTLPVPSWHTGRLWLLRLGYYKLTRPKEIANDWVWIVDHSIQSGTEKCFVILGLRLSSLESLGPLRHEDVEPIELLPVTKSNGEVVYQQLESATEKTGIPRQIVADRGSDLISGINKFCDQHKETCCIYDIKHKSASVLKQALNENPSWKEFATLAARTKLALQQTALAHLLPPNQKTKARDMNVGDLLRWGLDILAFLERQACEPDSRYDQAKIKEKLGWVANFSESFQEWGEILHITDKVESFVRNNGVYHGCDRDLENWLGKDASNVGSASIVRRQLIEFVRSESLKAHPGERLVASSEVIESVFGKLKQIEKYQAKSGFTSLILSVAAMVSKTTADVISKAMENTPVKKVREWGEKYIGQSVQSKRKEEFGPHKNKKQKWDHDFYGG